MNNLIKAHVDNTKLYTAEDKKAFSNTIIKLKDGGEIKAFDVMNNRFETSLAKELERKQFAKLITKGYSFISSEFREITEEEKEAVREKNKKGGLSYNWDKKIWKRRDSFFLQQNLSVFDFDNAPHANACDSKKKYKLDLNELFDRLSASGLTPAIAYHSLSSSPELPKIRTANPFISPVTDFGLASSFAAFLREFILEESDQKSISPSQIWYPGKEIIGIINELDTINVMDFDRYFWNFCCYKRPKNPKQYQIEAYTKFLSKSIIPTGLQLSKIPILSPSLAVFMLINENLVRFGGAVIYSINPPKNDEEISVKNPSSNTQVFFTNSSERESEKSKYYQDSKRNLDIKDGYSKLIKSCELANEVCDIGKKHSNDILVGIGTTFSNTKSGTHFYLDIIKKKHIETGNNSSGKLSEIENSLRGDKYFPWSCSRMQCPFIDTCHRRGTTPHAQMAYKASSNLFIDNTQLPEYIASETARTTYKSKFKEFIDTPISDTTCGLFGETGIGKTELMIEMLANDELSRVIYASPMHRNNIEIAERVIAKNPSMKVRIDSPLGDIAILKPKTPLENEYLQEKRNRNLALHFGGDRELIAQQILLTNNEAYKAKLREDLKSSSTIHMNKNVLMTHSKLAMIHDFPNHDTIIIDEAFDNSLTPSITVSEYEIHRLIKLIDTFNPEKSIRLASIKYYLYWLLELKLDVIVRPIKQNFTIEQWEEFIYSSSQFAESPVIDLPLAQGYIRDINTTTRINNITGMYKLTDFKNKKVIVLSGSLDERVFKMQYGNNVNFVHTGLIEKKTLIRQHANFTMTLSGIYNLIERGDLNKALAAIQLQPSDIGIICTFQKYVPEIKEKYKGHAIDYFHFGATEGINSAAGKNALIIGTPYNPSNSIRLEYAVLTGDFEMVNKKKEIDHSKKQTITRKGHTASLTLFANEELRHLEAYHIEKNLIQAIGRVRPIDNNAIVELVSPFPIGGNVEIVNNL